MGFWKSMAGILVVTLTSAEPEMALSIINQAGIEIFQIQQQGDLSCSFCIRRKDFSRLRDICEKRGESLEIARRKGIYWLVKSLLSRKVLLSGTFLLLAVILYLPSRIYFVRVEGNESVPSKRILAAAEDSGISFGAFRRDVRSEKVKNALLSAVPELQWAGVNTSGCVATISVRERSEPEKTTEKKQVSNMVAVRDGYILSGTVTQGNAVFQEGQTVKAGQILISGYTDCGLCIRATRAEGEVFAQTSRNLNVVTPSNCIQRGSIQNIKKKISLLIRKKRINLWKDSGISDSSCGRMYEEYYVTLPGGYQLPIALCVEEFFFYELQVGEILQTDVEEGLAEFADGYLMQQMIAGEIQNRFQTVVQENGAYRLLGEYVCVEMIGREQIGDINGKNS